MSSLALAHDAFAPVEPPGRGRGLAFAVIAHLLLVAALAWSVRWKTSEPEGVTAELWSALPQTAAPRPTAEPTPAPRERVEPPPAPTRADTTAHERADAQIAVERAAKEREQRAREVRDLAARRSEKLRADAERDKERALEAERDKRRLADEQAHRAEQAKTRQDEARAAAQHEANVRRMMAQAGGGSDSTSPGTAARSSGPSAGYAGRIKARIKPNIVLTGSIAGNPTAEVEVRVAPDGTIVGKKLTKSSGSPLWDETVLRAIDKTEVLPRDIDGRVPPVIPMSFRPNE